MIDDPFTYGSFTLSVMFCPKIALRMTLFLLLVCGFAPVVGSWPDNMMRVLLISYRFSNVARMLKHTPCEVLPQKFYKSITSIFGHMHDVLNVDEKIDFHRLPVNCETNLLSLISP